MECDLVYAYNFLGATLPHLCLIMFGLYEFRRSPLDIAAPHFFSPRPSRRLLQSVPCCCVLLLLPKRRGKASRRQWEVRCFLFKSYNLDTDKIRPQNLVC